MLLSGKIQEDDPSTTKIITIKVQNLARLKGAL